MSTFGDVVDDLLTYAGKKGEENRSIVEGRIRGVINDLNTALSNYTVEGRVVDLSVAEGATVVTLDKEIRRVNQIGRYDSATERMQPPYHEITEREFNIRFGLVTTISAIAPTSVNEWFFVNELSDNERRIRLVYPPNAAFTMMVTHYEKLTEENVDRLELEDILANGGMARLAKWFPEDAGLAHRRYKDQLMELRSARRSIRRTVITHVRPDTASHNATAANLVN